MVVGEVFAGFDSRNMLALRRWIDLQFAAQRASSHIGVRGALQIGLDAFVHRMQRPIAVFAGGAWSVG
jgi:hypothetical protein